MAGPCNLTLITTIHSGYVLQPGLFERVDSIIPPLKVDTKANPPRAIWTHPYEDEQFLNDHPEIRRRLAKGQPDDAPPPYSAPASPRRHSYSGEPSSSAGPMRTGRSQPGTPAAGAASSSKQAMDAKHRGFFGKLKDKAIGTKEEREEAKRLEAEVRFSL